MIVRKDEEGSSLIDFCSFIFGRVAIPTLQVVTSVHPVIGLEARSTRRRGTSNTRQYSGKMLYTEYITVTHTDSARAGDVLILIFVVCVGVPRPRVGTRTIETF